MSLDPRRNAYRADLADERLKGHVEAARFIKGTAGSISAPVSSLHRSASYDSGVDTQALSGESILIFEQKDDWAWIQLTTDNYVGYVPRSDISTAISDITHKVHALRTFVYPDASLKTPTDRYLSMGSLVSVTGHEGDYSALSNGGYVYTRHLAAIDTHAADFVTVAESLLNTPYLWGGKSSLGIDCSGLVQLSLAQAGIQSPRDSSMQEEELGSEITIPDNLYGLKRGDFVFWKGHVGIMINPRRMIHANGWTMSVAVEELAAAALRIRESGGGPITRIRRLKDY
ncbi:NlpC/P60 family protein [Microvirga sp. W0021]|uniref:NlpC/P60 family protein n=1 Tax=Hohaiivirga grylli TaxID=3133970 RepID=A0ABV0BIK9_9HYPH